jgi:hypothetical protein
MKTRSFLTRLWQAGGSPVMAVGTVVLLATGGCGLLPNEDEGDLVDPTMAEYRVSILPTAVVLTDHSPDAMVYLNVTCVGMNLPPACAQNAPGWSFENPARGIVKVEIDQDDQTSTTAKLSIDPTALAAQGSEAVMNNSPLLGAQSTALVAFFPENVPAGLRAAGQRWVIVQFPLPRGPDVRQPAPALQPELKIGPRPLSIQVRGTGQISSEVTIIYKGQPTELVDIALSGADAAKFRLLRPILPLATDKLFAVRVPVTFLGLTDANDYKTYSAEITARTQNGITRTNKVFAGQNL